jgi:ubiquinone biosynthesis protein UbiJ
MFQALLEPLGREALARVTLLLNHVIHAEPEAVRRLSGQVGCSVAVVWQQWPGFLPLPPAPVWRITPAGLLDLEDGPVDAASATLQVTLGGSELIGWVLSGAAGRPPMDIRGDAGFAAEVSWLAEHLRWDIEDDLARIVGDGPARMLGRVGGAVLPLLRGLLQRMPRPGSAAG